MATFQTREECWKDFPDIKDKTEKYELRVRNVAQSQWFTKDYWHPWMNDKVGNTAARLKYWDLSGDAIGQSVDIANAYDCYSAIFIKPKTGAPTSNNGSNHQKNPTRRLIIMESINPRTAELLGAMLDIPPEFWLAHCSVSSNMEVATPILEMLGNTNYWRVSIPYTVAFNKTHDWHDDKGFALSLGNFVRKILLSPFDQRIPHDIHACVSFWGAQHDNNSWTTILVFDPIECFAHSLYSSSPVPFNFASGKPYDATFLKFKIVSPTSSDTNGTDTKKGIVGIKPPFYDVVDALEAGATQSCVDFNEPFAATVTARNIILAYWKRHVYYDGVRTANRVINDVRKSRSPGAWQKMAQETATNYNELKTALYINVESKKIIRSITWAFRCHNQDASCGDIPAQERMAWAKIDQEMDDYYRQLVDHMQSYAQRAAIIETLSANHMARSSGQLTKIATAIIPASFTASLLSMNDDFAAGKPMFYVYWALTIPITIGLLVWVIYGEELGRKWDEKKWSQTFRERSAEKLARLSERLISIGNDSKV